MENQLDLCACPVPGSAPTTGNAAVSRRQKSLLLWGLLLMQEPDLKREWIGRWSVIRALEKVKRGAGREFCSQNMILNNTKKKKKEKWAARLVQLLEQATLEFRVREFQAPRWA